jgi:multicomponent Na+:H+ antiporter subunit G
VAAVLDIVRSSLGGAIALLGLVFVLGGAIGVLRFPDLYTRLHAARVGDGVGSALVLVGLAILSGDFVIGVRLLLLAVLTVALAPTLSHLAANAAHTGGLAPLAGRYTAPRPGVRRGEP